MFKIIFYIRNNIKYYAKILLHLLMILCHEFLLKINLIYNYN